MSALLQKRAFGNTAMQVSRLGLGSHELSNASFAETQRIVEAALGAGLTVIDTAECYGQSEELIGRSLGSRRQECYLFTKCGHASGLDLPDWTPRLIEQNIERSLKRLKTDYLDLVQLHSCSRQTLERGEVIEALQRAKAAGKTRSIGYSGDRGDALFAVHSGAFDTLQTSVNIVDQEAIDLLLTPAKARNMGIIAKHPIANAVWKTGQQPPVSTHLHVYWERLNTLNYDFLHGGSIDEIAAVALRFTLSIPQVDIAIVGTTNPQRIQQNLSSLAKGPLSEAEYAAIRKRWHDITRWRHFLPGGRRGWHGWN